MRPVTDVLIVGAGPTGLLLAGDLAAAGVSCAVIERREGRSNLTRAFAVHARSLEELDARGLADALVATGIPIGTLRFLGHGRLDLSVLPSRFPFLLVTPQYETERLLGERARALGARITTGAELVGLRQDAEQAVAEVRMPGGQVRHWPARYVVGCDGARSTVRRTLGLPFPGVSVVRSVMLADVRLADPPPEVLTANAVGDAFAFVVPYGDGWYRVIAWNRRSHAPDDAPVDLAELREVMRRALGTDHGMGEVRWLSRFHSDERQVPRYRAGRVFLAGDAAHVHSPAGGLGMNTGLQDACNLSWKLAAEVGGRAPEGLLDTYHTERHPVGTSVLRISGTLMRMALLRPRPLCVARGLALGVATRVPPVARRMAGIVSGIDLAYPVPPGAHPLTGRRAPDVPLAGGEPSRLYVALRGGRFVLVCPPEEPPPAGTAGEWAGRVDIATAAGPTRHTVLVRPDGYIAWATNEPDRTARAAALRTALTNWCGTPARRADVC